MLGMKYFTLLSLFLCFSTLFINAEIYQCSGFVFSGFPCRTTPLKKLTPAILPFKQLSAPAELEKTLQSMPEARFTSNSRKSVVGRCTRISGQLADLKLRRRQGYKASEETNLDRQKANLLQQHKTHCTRSRVRIIRGSRVSKQ